MGTTNNLDNKQSEREPRTRLKKRRRRTARIVLTPGGLLLLLTVNIIVLSALGWPLIQERYNFLFPASQREPSYLTTIEVAAPTWSSISHTNTPGPVNTPTPSDTVLSKSTATPYELESFEMGSIFLALEEGVETHLFAYQPMIGQSGSPIPLTRITRGPWNDIKPALSPDGLVLAFVSNRDGHWDLYLKHLTSGIVNRISDTSEFDSSPSWSPDGLWLVYETYYEDNLELFIRSVENVQDPIRLTFDSAADHSPAWSPQGRKIAFVSVRDGASQIWIMDLDKSDEARLTSISQRSGSQSSHPAWSPDGRYLAWSMVTAEGFHNLYVWDSFQPDESALELGSGDWPVWGSDGKIIYTTVLLPDAAYLTAYQVDSSGYVFPVIPLPGPVAGLDLGVAKISEVTFEDIKTYPTALWEPIVTQEPVVPGNRQRVVSLDGIEAPFSNLHDMVDESFTLLRERTASSVGWDFLMTLENAFVPLTSPLAPGMVADWLYTGRAFTVNSMPINAGWMVVVREDFGYETYWRIFLRSRFQDGSQGMPLHQLIWNFDARYRGEPDSYEHGGEYSQILPSGYWVDFTQLASAYGWQRLPALSTWRVAYSAARFNEFVLTGGLDWETAMLEIYPPEILITPTKILPSTGTPTSTPRWYRSPTPTLSVTPRPTITPSSSATLSLTSNFP